MIDSKKYLQYFNLLEICAVLKRYWKLSSCEIIAEIRMITVNSLLVDTYMGQRNFLFTIKTQLLQPGILFWGNMPLSFQNNHNLGKILNHNHKQQKCTKKYRRSRKKGRNHTCLTKLLALTLTCYRSEVGADMLHKCVLTSLDLCHVEDVARKYSGRSWWLVYRMGKTKVWQKFRGDVSWGLYKIKFFNK